MEFHVQMKPNPDTMYRTAFLEQVKAYDPNWISVVCDTFDLVDPEGPVALSNLPLNSYHLRLVDVVLWKHDGRQLYPELEAPPVNTGDKEKTDVEG